MKKRVLAALLALVMLFGALPMSVFADNLETVEGPSGTFEPDEPEKYTYHLYYDFNYVGDGSTKWNIEYGPTADTSYTYTVDSQTLTCREGYNFLGWADGKNATEPDYRGGDTITLTWQNPTKTIYAVWEKQPQPDITDPTEFISEKYVSVQCDAKPAHSTQYMIEGLIDKACAELVWSTGSKEATLKLYPEKIAKRFSALKGTHTAVSTSVVTVTLTYNGGWKIDGAIPVIYVTCAAPEIPDPTDFVKTQYVSMLCKDNTNHKISKLLENLPSDAWDVVWTRGSKEATLKLHPAKIAPLYTMGGAHKAVDESTVTVTLSYTNRWSIAGTRPAIPAIQITCAAPEIPDPTDYVKGQYVTVACDDQTAHPNIQYQLKNLPADSVAVQWDRTATTAKLVLKPEKIAEHYGKSYGAHTAVNPADVEVPLTYANDAWSLSAAIPEVHVTCKPTYLTLTYDANAPAGKTVTNLPKPQTEPLPEGSNVVTFQLSKDIPVCEGYEFLGWTTDTSSSIATFPVEDLGTDSWVSTTGNPNYILYAVWEKNPFHVTYRLKDENGKWVNAYEEDVPVAGCENHTLWTPAEKTGYKFTGWYQKAEDIGKKSEVTKLFDKTWVLYGDFTPVEYTITYDYRDKDIADKNLYPENAETYTIEDTVTLNPITNKGMFGKTFLEWRCDLDKDGVAEKITEIPVGTTGNLTVYAYWNYPVSYTVYDEDGNEVEAYCETINVPEDSFGANLKPKSVEKDGYEFDGWYQNPKNFGNPSKRTETLDNAKNWKLYGELKYVEKPVYVYVQPTYKDSPLTKSDAKAVAALARLGFTEGFNAGGKFVTLGKLMTAKTDVAGMAGEIDDGKLALYSAIDTTKFDEHVLNSIGWYGEDALEFVTNSTHKGYEADGKIDAYHLNGTMSFQSVTFDAGTNDKVENMPADGYYLVNDHITLGEPTREGYTFLGWSAAQDTPVITANPETDGEPLYPAGHEWTVIGDVTFTAVWEPVEYTITYNWRGVVKPADVKNVNNPETFTADELPITLQTPDFKNNEWPQKFLNWRDAEGNVVTQITESGNVELYAYYQFPVRYTVYDENGQKVDNLSVTDWYNEDDFAAYNLKSGEQTGHDFDGWYQTTKDFGNTNKRVTKLNMAKKYELVGKLTRKEYTVTASLFLNGSEEAAKDARGVVISRSVKGLYGDLIDYPELEKQLKEAALAADAANKPNPDMADINICLNDKSGKPFDAATYGQEGYNWRNMQWPENNPTKKWIVAYAWAYVDTYYDVTFNVDMEGVTPVATQTVKCNETANEPTAPTKEGYKFLGWFEKDAAEPFDFTTPITKSMTLTAKWELNLQTVNVVIYRNGDTTKEFKTVALEKQPKGTVIDLTTLDIANYYTANSTGKYDFYGWYNDGKWNEYKANPETPPAGLDSITVNGWTNIICMVYDYENVIVRAITDDDKTTETQLFSGMARRGSNLLDYLAAQNIELEKVGHTHDEWYNYDSPQWKFGENDTIKGWTNVLVKYARKEYTVVANMYLDGAPHYRQNTDFYTYQVTGLYGDPIDFTDIKAQAIAQAEKDRPASASYDASVIEDWAGNATCTTFGEHQPDLDKHYVNVHVNTTQHVYVYRMIDGKMEPTAYHHSTAPFGANVVEHLNANVQNLDMPGYSHDEWFNKDVPALDVKFGDTDTINGWTNVVIKYTKNEFPVTYDYACTDPALVPHWKVWETLPENPYTYAPGESVRVAMMPDDVEDGEYIWKFVTWKLGDTEVAPNTQVPMVAGGLTFVGIWERTQKEYGVTYSYDSSLPAEVQATIPKNPHTYTVGQMVTTAAKPDSVRVGEYIWTFKTWKLDGVEVAPNTQVPMVSGGLHFEGIWETKLIHYSLTIQYVDKKGKELAESHMDLLAKGEAYKVDSPKIKGYKLKEKEDAVIEGKMPGHNLTIEVVYIKKSTGGSSGTIDSPNKPTTKAPALTLNTDDHFAFINGYPDGSVQPEGNVTRAETAAILYRIMGDACQSYYKTNSSSYSDVARGDWYNTYVATLENAGVIVDTRTNGKFRPNDAITRAELASMIAQFAGLESASAAKFNDVGSRYWAAEEIAIAAKMGWINGYPDGSFRPDRNVTRAELMAMVNRALGRTPKSADDLLSGMKTWRDNANVNAWYYLDVQEATNDHTYTKSGTHETWKKLL
ncbi:MAG: InlB B-repeat-containing protein [Firmicutes bacterium]|nr:InlB B-repeat-containing protein [Bacillota bacterium]